MVNLFNKVHCNYAVATTSLIWSTINIVLAGMFEQVENSSSNVELYKKLLQTGRSILRLQVGIVSKVYDAKYELIAIDDVADEFNVGEILDLNLTFCRDVVSTGKTIVLPDVNRDRGTREHPLYSSKALEAYIGVPIFAEGSIWGTINFSSMIERSAPFSSAEIALVEAYAALVSESISE